MKRRLLDAATHPALLPLSRRLRRRHAVVLTWHRFADRPTHPDRYPVALLRKHLEMFRRHRYDIVGLPDLVARFEDPGADLSRVVAFTVDDGYADFASLAAEVFLAFDCPVTTFVTTGFLDGQVWMWWDQVEYCLTSAGKRAVVVEIGGEVLDLDLSAAARPASALRLWTALKRLPTPDRLARTADLAAQLEVEIPAAPPDDCRPMRWDEVRSLSRRGLRFAPHTVTHPVLSRSSVAEAKFEIEESWRRVRMEEPSAEAFFAYPNGLASDFNAGHVAVLERLGFQGAVTMALDYASVGGSSWRFELPRFSAMTDTAVLRQIAGGLERMVRVWRAIR